MKLLVLLVFLVVGKRSAVDVKVDALEKAAQLDLKTMGASIEQYKLLGGVYPSTEQGIAALVKKPQVPPRPRRWAQMFQKIPLDPWKRPYQYKLVNGKFTLWSTGPNAKDASDDLLYVAPKKKVEPEE